MYSLHQIEVIFPSVATRESVVTSYLRRLLFSCSYVSCPMKQIFQ